MVPVLEDKIQNNIKWSFISLNWNKNILKYTYKPLGTDSILKWMVEACIILYMWTVGQLQVTLVCTTYVDYNDFPYFYFKNVFF